MSHPQLYAIHTLGTEELHALKHLSERLSQQFETCESEGAADAISQAAEELPLSLRAAASNLRLGKGPRALLIRGLDVAEDGPLMPTPNSWDSAWTEPRTIKLEIRQALIASLVGEIFGWHTQENGRYFRNVIPHPKDANEQLGSSSAVDLEWHNEEAFHPSRADWILLHCYRNHEKAVTTVCDTGSLELSPEVEAILRQPRFIILPDTSHRPDFNKSSHWKLSQTDFDRIQSMLNNPEPQPVISGLADDRYIRIDPAFMRAIDPEAEAALKTIKAEIDLKMIDLNLNSGEFLLIDNLRAVHGRKIYTPHYGPEQRWMRRVNIAADLNKGGRNVVAGSKRRFL